MVSSGCSCKSRSCSLSLIFTRAVEASSSSRIVTPGCCLSTTHTRRLRRTDGVTMYSLCFRRLAICLENLVRRGFIGYLSAALLHRTCHKSIRNNVAFNKWQTPCRPVPASGLSDRRPIQRGHLPQVSALFSVLPRLHNVDRILKVPSGLSECVRDGLPVHHSVLPA